MLLYVAENAIGESELGEVDIALRKKLLRSGPAEVLRCQQTGDALLVRAHESIAKHSRGRRPNRRSGARMCGHRECSDQQRQAGKRSSFVHSAAEDSVSNGTMRFISGGSANKCASILATRVYARPYE